MRRHDEEADTQVRLSARIEDLEDRIRRLEALLRTASAALRTRAAAPGGRRAAVQAKLGRPRPRCPGCTLELPQGHRSQQCVWCGFHFAALRRARLKGR